MNSQPWRGSMLITDSRIDAGKAFDWGRTSGDYAKYRDIYPDVFYKKIVDTWTWEQVPVFFPAICIGMERTGQEQIFLRNRSKQQGVWQKQGI